MRIRYRYRIRFGFHTTFVSVIVEKHAVYVRSIMIDWCIILNARSNTGCIP